MIGSLLRSACSECGSRNIRHMPARELVDAVSPGLRPRVRELLGFLGSGGSAWACGDCGGFGAFG